MSLQVIQQAVSGIAQSQVFRVSITNVPAVVHRWITKEAADLDRKERGIEFDDYLKL